MRIRTEKPRVAYNDPVKGAPCFEWIDSNLKGLDSDRCGRRFSRRKPGRPYSPVNKERLRRPAAKGKVVREVPPALSGPDLGRLDIADDLLEAIKAHKVPWRDHRRFSEGYKRIRVSLH